MPAFLELPREVRDRIYRYCLEVDFLIVPHKHTDPHSYYPAQRDEQLPSTALLTVNKQVRAESRPILYGNNTWKLTAIPTKGNLFDIVEPWLFTAVAIRLSGTDAVVDERMHHAQIIHDLDGEVISSLGGAPPTKARRHFLIHLACLAKVLEAWKWITDTLEGMTKVRLVWLDLSFFFCPLACCRFDLFGQEEVERLFELLLQGKPFKAGSPRVFFVGVWREKEQQLVYDELGFPRLSPSVGEVPRGFRTYDGNYQCWPNDDDEESVDEQASSIPDKPAAMDLNDTYEENQDMAEDESSDSPSTEDESEPTRYNYKILKNMARGR